MNAGCRGALPWVSMTGPNTPTEPPANGDEASTLIGSLERQRRTFFWKCAGLDDAWLRTTVGASSMTVGGLLKHLALVESHYFAVKLWDRPIAPPFDQADFDADPDWEWRTAGEDSAE